MWERITAIGTVVLIILTVVLISQGPPITWLHWPGFILPLIVVLGLVVAAIFNFRTARIHARTANKDILDPPQVDRQREAQLKLVPLMRQAETLDGKHTSIQNPAELIDIQCGSREWVREIIAILDASGHETDAVALAQVGGVPPSADQMASFEDWKRYEVSQWSLYRKKLAQIMDNRRL